MAATQSSFVPFIPENAPFSPEQRSWLNGFLAGLYSGAPAGEAAAGSAASRGNLHILYGSQTGNAETLARQAAKAAKGKGYQVTSSELDSFERDKLASIENLLLITSTYGEGDPPDNAESVHAYLMGESAPALESLNYAVLGLGDTNYADFNKAAKEFDARLQELGGRRIKEGLWCDTDFEEPAAAFIESALESYAATAASGSAEPEVAAPTASSAPAHSKKNPFPAAILENVHLNGPESAKQTRHVALSLEGSGLAYDVGDALGVLPENNPRLVDDTIEATGFAQDAPTPLPDKSEAPLHEALRRHYDITRLSKPFLDACARCADSQALNDLLKDESALAAYLDGRHMLDPLLEFKPRFRSTEDLIASLRKLQPRLYSIASGPRAHPGEVHLTVGVVRWEAHERVREGICSNFLAELKKNEKARVFVQPNKNFKLPSDPGTAVIMVGPGTGIAPFRAFLEERQAAGAKGANWLFFGDRTAAGDFLYREQLEAWHEDGFLTRLDTAFSRDQAEKIYVQDRMREHGEELYAWIENGACFYVCGDAHRMAKDVHDALLHIAREHGGKDPDQAAAWLKDLQKQKRYLRDVY